MTQIPDEDFDFWPDRLKILVGGYNSEVDNDILNVARLIVESRLNDTSIYCDTIADRLGLSAKHVELIQYIIGSVHYPAKAGEGYYANDPFTYGTSPRGLFVDNIDSAKAFIREFEVYMTEHWS